MTQPEIDLTKRFIAFSYMQYYPCGGMDDAIGSYDTEEEAIAALGAEEEVWGDCVPFV